MAGKKESEAISNSSQVTKSLSRLKSSFIDLEKSVLKTTQRLSDVLSAIAKDVDKSSRTGKGSGGGGKGGGPVIPVPSPPKAGGPRIKPPASALGGKPPGRKRKGGDGPGGDGDGGDAAKALNNAKTGFAVEMVKLGAELSAKIEAVLSEFNKASKSLMLAGGDVAKGLDGTIVKHSEATRGISSDINNLKLSLAATQSGLGRLDANTTAVLMSQKMLGGDMNRTAMSLASLTAGTGQSSQETGTLAKNIQHLSTTFNIGVDKLSESLSKASEIINLGIATGAGPQMMNQLGKTLSLVGPALSDDLSKAMSSFIGSDEGMLQAGMLGVTDRREEAQKGGDTTGLLIESGRKLEEELKKLTAYGDPSIGQKIFTDMYGQNAMVMIKSLREMEKKADESGLTLSEYVAKSEQEAEQAKLLSTSIDQVAETFTAGFNDMITFMMPAIEAVMPVLGFIAKTIGAVLAVLTIAGAVLGLIYSVTLIQGIFTKLIAASGFIRTAIQSMSLGVFLLIVLAIMALIAALTFWGSKDDDNSKESNTNLKKISKNTEDKKEDEASKDFINDFANSSRIRFNLGPMANQGDMRASPAAENSGSTNTTDMVETNGHLQALVDSSVQAQEMRARQLEAAKEKSNANRGAA